jgi:putative hydrolase
MFELDPHTHSLASGHAGNSTITDLAKQASRVGLKALGLTDHGPATPGSSRSSYFRNLAHAPKKRCGIELLYGVELNISDFDGSVDLDDEILEKLDYAIISMHMPNIKPGTVEENTFAYINAMNHPHVKIIGHPEDVKYPVDFEALVIAAKHYDVAVEINNSSLSPKGYRGNVRENVVSILDLCKKHRCPIVVSSDSHGSANVGNFQYATAIMEECNFPSDLVINRSLKEFKSFIEK